MVVIFPGLKTKFFSKKKAQAARKIFAAEVQRAKRAGSPINLRFRVIKKGKLFFLLKESKRRKK